MTDAGTVVSKYAVLVCNGPLEDGVVSYLHAAVRKADLLVGVDGGAKHLRALGLSPHVITGDFDSLTPAEVEKFCAEGATVISTPDQDYTDLDKALAYVIGNRRVKRVDIFGGVGGRLDHTYSVLSTLIKYGRCTELRLIDVYGETFPIYNTGAWIGDHLVGRTLSLMAFGEVTGIRTAGLRWPLSNETLAPGVRDGTLNEIIEPVVTITLVSGSLLVLLHHVPPA